MKTNLLKPLLFVAIFLSLGACRAGCRADTASDMTEPGNVPALSVN